MSDSVFLERENADLRIRVQTLEEEVRRQISKNGVLRRAQEKALILPGDMEQKFRHVQYRVDDLALQMVRLLENQSHRDRVISAVKTAGQAQMFRNALTHDKNLRELAKQPRMNDAQMLTVCMWRFLIAKVFSYQGWTSFYSSAGQNAGYYLKNIGEIDDLMQHESGTPEDTYLRRMWRKQATDAIFRTGQTYGAGDDLFPKEDHPWLASTRQANINQLASQILQAFDVFLGALPRGPEMVRELVARAVHLNECIMHQAEVGWTIELDTTGESNDHFYNNIGNMDMVAVNTDSGDHVNLMTAMRGMSQSDIRRRLYNVCAIKPALKSQECSASGEMKLILGSTKTNVGSNVAVGWALNRDNLKPPTNPSVFYIMAQSLGFAPLSNS